MMIKGESYLALASDSAGTRLASFKEVVVAGEDAQAKLAPLRPDEILNDSVMALIREYAICNECHGVFHVHPTALTDADQEQFRSTVNGMQLRLDALNYQKQELIRSKQYDQVLALTTQIRDQENQLTVAKRGFERLSTLSCPFCGSAVAP